MNTEMQEIIKEVENKFIKDCIMDDILSLFDCFPLIREGYRKSDGWYDDIGLIRVKSYFSVLVLDKDQEWDEEFIIDESSVRYIDGTESFITEGMNRAIMVKRLKQDDFDAAFTNYFKNLKRGEE